MKLIEKDSQIKNLDGELNDLTNEFNECKTNINSRIYSAKTRGINDSISQIKFLQNEVLSNKNILSEKHKENLNLNDQIKNINNDTENIYLEAEKINKKMIESKK